jgi:hypothetical protein
LKPDAPPGTFERRLEEQIIASLKEPEQLLE